MDGSQYKNLLVTQLGAVVTVIINRRRNLNAINNATYLELARALTEADTNDTVSIVLITGSGEYFCSGTDMLEFMQTVERLEALKRSQGSTGAVGSSGQSALGSNPAVRSTGQASSSVDLPHDFDPFASPVGQFMRGVLRFSKILVAAVNGPAIGIGVTLLPHCDLVFAADSATFWVPFLRIALVPEFGSSVTLPQLLGRALANDLLLTSRVLSADEACRNGLVSRVFPDEILQSEVLAILSDIQQEALFQKSLPLFKRMLRQPLGDSAPRQPDMEAVVGEELRQVARRQMAGETGYAVRVTMKAMKAMKAAKGGSKAGTEKSRSRL
ncbi:hypothetical protein CLOM_g12404 [Closterium sp. NIES-68]|nr:hypothetical protein CLOM_g12404 [Closterium sp. NIES-68]GJP77530.1 hypothetical protein CLOP_g7908 [Closterium sp. NIES-67]